MGKIIVVRFFFCRVKIQYGVLLLNVTNVLTAIGR